MRYLNIPVTWQPLKQGGGISAVLDECADATILTESEATLQRGIAFLSAWATSAVQDRTFQQGIGFAAIDCRMVECNGLVLMGWRQVEHFAVVCDSMDQAKAWLLYWLNKAEGQPIKNVVSQVIPTPRSNPMVN